MRPGYVCCTAKPQQTPALLCAGKSPGKGAKAPPEEGKKGKKGKGKGGRGRATESYKVNTGHARIGRNNTFMCMPVPG